MSTTATKRQRQRTPLERATNDFFALLGARRIAQRNGLAPPAPEALTAAAANLLAEFADTLPTNEPPPEPAEADVPADVTALKDVVDEINTVVRDLAAQVNAGPDRMDAVRTGALIKKLRGLVQDQLGAVDQVNSSPGGDTDQPAPIEHTPEEVTKSLVASCLSTIVERPARFAARTPLDQAAEHQRQFALSLAARAQSDLAAVPAARRHPTDSRGFPLA